MESGAQSVLKAGSCDICKRSQGAAGDFHTCSRCGAITCSDCSAQGGVVCRECAEEEVAYEKVQLLQFAVFGVDAN